MYKEDGSLQIFNQVTQRDLFPNLVEQLNKDFRFSGISDEIDKKITPNKLHEEVANIVYILINRNFSDYLNLLYRVDISETEIKKLDGTDIEKLAIEVTLLILKRECQKVLLRNKL